MNSKVALMGIAIVVCGFLYVREMQQSKALRDALEAMRAAKNALEAQISESQKAQIDPAELERLRGEQREAIRLRGELTNLKQQVSSANERAARATVEAEKAKAKAKADEEAPAKLVVPKVFSKQTQVNLPPGQSLMMGGWETAPGKRTYAFVTPTTDPQFPNQVLVSARLVEMDLPVANQFASMAADGNGNVTFNAEDSEALFKGFKETPGVSLVASPRIQTTSGVAGSVSVTHQMPTKDGMMDFGPQIGVTPTIGADGKIHLAVDAKITMEGD
jgi:hypothetical protein